MYIAWNICNIKFNHNIVIIFTDKRFSTQNTLLGMLSFWERLPLTFILPKRFTFAHCYEEPCLYPSPACVWPFGDGTKFRVQSAECQDLMCRGRKKTKHGWTKIARIVCCMNCIVRKFGLMSCEAGLKNVHIVCIWPVVEPWAWIVILFSA